MLDARWRTVAAALLLAAPLGSFAAPDTDGDGVVDALDNCVLVANAPPLDCDTDQDGYGNACDADFDQGGTVNANDWKFFWIPAWTSGNDTTGADMDCNGAVTSGDALLFVDYFETGEVGPSGLACAGSPPCP